jgi:hypothetical protein
MYLLSRTQSRSPLHTDIEYQIVCIFVLDEVNAKIIFNCHECDGYNGNVQRGMNEKKRVITNDPLKCMLEWGRKSGLVHCL